MISRAVLNNSLWMPTNLEDKRPSATDISLWTIERWREIMSHCKSKQKTRIYCFTLRNFAWLGFYVFHVIPEIFTNSVWMLWNISLDYGSYSDSEFKWDEQCFHPISQRAIKTSDGFYTSTGMRSTHSGIKMSLNVKKACRNPKRILSEE